jgi:hypothetical protein
MLAVLAELASTYYFGFRALEQVNTYASRFYDISGVAVRIGPSWQTR